MGFSTLPRWLRAAIITGIETVGLTLWLVTYVPAPYINPPVSTIILYVILYPEHYLALKP